NTKMKDDNTVQVRELIDQKKQKKSFANLVEKAIPFFLFIITSISIFTTIGIIFTLSTETIEFFKRVPILDFFTGNTLEPLSQDPSFGVLPLITGTFFSSVIAIIVAAPIGLMSAIYLSEYASDRVNKTIKPLLEILAGILTIAFGFFAVTLVNAIIEHIFPALNPTKILCTRNVMRIMIIPMSANMSEDAISSEPNSIIEGALGLVATKLEVTTRVVIPAALSGIISSFV